MLEKATKTTEKLNKNDKNVSDISVKNGNHVARAKIQNICKGRERGDDMQQRAAGQNQTRGLASVYECALYQASYPDARAHVSNLYNVS